MASQLLETKLYAPRPRPGLVARPRLLERIDRGAGSKLTLVSAPAGFGKSTLLAGWLASSAAERSDVAWLSLDDSDNQPGAFWLHLVAALRTVDPAFGGRTLALLDGGQPVEAALTPLLNELHAAPNDVVLVLDDYHSIEAPDIHEGMGYLVDHLPDRTHLVIATRADPPLSLARLRARGELTEIRAADLRFAPEEATAYLNGVLDLGLSDSNVTALESRTEGWIAALQLAAISLQGRVDAAGFIAGFAGDDRYIVDYLVEEVLQREPTPIRSFLLETAILDRLSGPLCDAVTGRAGSQATLEAIDRRNLFLIPLDDRRHWFRYHHLFADVLRSRLLAEAPDQVAALHRRAAEWHEQNGERSVAIRHALAGEDFPRAADLIELAMSETHRYRQEATLRRWIERLPNEVLRLRPVLSNAYAGTILTRGEIEGVETRLQDAERGLAALTADVTDGDPDADVAAYAVVDQQAFRRLPGWIANHRAGQARLLGDVAGTIFHARRALDLFDPDDDYGRGGASALLGLAHWTNGDLEAASERYAGTLRGFEQAGYLSDVMGVSIALADMRMAQGRLSEALRIQERSLDITVGLGRVLRGAADMHVGISEILLERDDLSGAAHHLRRAEDLGDEFGLPQNPYRSRVAAARLRRAEGDLGAALLLLREAERRYNTDFSPPVRPVTALTARLQIAQGDLAAASAWAREQDLSADDELTYVREFEHATLARSLLAQASRDRTDTTIVLDLLGRLLAAADAGGRAGSVIDLLVVQAMAHHEAGDRAAALAALERALRLAEPEGYVRVFADEGPPMAALLKLAAKQPRATAYVRRLQAATASASAASASAAIAPGGDHARKQPLIESLSERELEVLRLLDSDLDGPDIARELNVSLPTVRTHTRNVYAKLGVNGRRAAVRRAAELGLLSSDRER